ncbi:four-helix bundle copper-binding protein [Rhodocytophaga aerolata]|uniref:Four-helix bundle copper-binding protein n=1 Tax=Rhodocytophaga aerolata TaxID=455078 RepID=A0ABT8R7C9_9BACT|nr:four-helix bundle copper-binding protein [Rhodocytophaga aerolata]MDO1446590.1 four-helix bundle copper-binding protein [Rhodocytophaga aerolata]
MQTQQHQDLIRQLLECAFTCENCATACLQEKDVQMMARCIALDRDCSDICLQAARLLQRHSEVAAEFLQVCEKICQMCGDECAKHHHEHCQQCAQACHSCAEACRSAHV